MNTILKDNITVCGRSERLFVGIALIASVMFFGNVVPLWLTLVAVYPVITAIMSWDPIFAAFLKVRSLVGPLEYGRKTPVVS